MGNRGRLTGFSSEVPRSLEVLLDECPVEVRETVRDRGESPGRVGRPFSPMEEGVLQKGLGEGGSGVQSGMENGVPLQNLGTELGTPDGNEPFSLTRRLRPD